MSRIVAAVALAAVVDGARIARRTATKELSGVPLINYEYRDYQYDGPSVAQHAGMYDWNIKFKDGATDDDMTAFCAEGGCVSMGHAAGVAIAAVRGTELDLLRMVKGKEDKLEWMEPDVPVFAEPVMGEEYHEESSKGVWSLDRIGVSSAQQTGKGVHVYVMDTGVRASHRDFGGRVIPTIDTVRGGGKVYECDPGDYSCAKDDNSHGTHVAGTVGGSTYGVAKEATIHAMKVCCGAGSNIIGSMDWLALNRQRPAVMTMSLGSYSTPMSSRIAVEAVVAAGITVTVSAGNRGNWDSCKKSYTFIKAAIGVGASDSRDTRATFSNYGTCNAIFAPGVDIESTSFSSDTGARTKSGTSMAAPAVAGASALLLEENPNFSPQQIRNQLRERAASGVLKSLKTGDPNLLLQVR